MHTLYSTRGDSYPVWTLVLKDKGATTVDPNDPDTWSAIDLSSDSVRIDYYVSRLWEEFTVDETNNLLEISETEFTDDQRVRIYTSGTIPTGLALATLYYVIGETEDETIGADDIKVSASLEGAAVAISDEGTGEHFASLQYATQTTTFTTDGTNGSIYFQHPADVYNYAGTYEMEVVIVYAGGGYESVYDKMKAVVREK